MPGRERRGRVPGGLVSPGHAVRGGAHPRPVLRTQVTTCVEAVCSYTTDTAGAWWTASTMETTTTAPGAGARSAPPPPQCQGGHNDGTNSFHDLISCSRDDRPGDQVDKIEWDD